LYWWVGLDSSIAHLADWGRLWRPTPERGQEDERRKNQDLRTTRAKILYVDWRIHPCRVEYIQKGMSLRHRSVFMYFITVPRCGYRRKSIKKIQILSIRNSDFDVCICIYIYSYLRVVCNGETLRYPGIFITVLLSVCIESPARRLRRAVFALVHMCIHGSVRVYMMVKSA
jgi:hypothetical protein